jgi:HD superfamily phosphohydrolase YqeK
MVAVSELLAGWAAELGLSEPDRIRWAAAGWLHDALRDADGDGLAAEASDFAARVRHGPAVAARLEKSGVDDEELLGAIRYHTLGRRGWGRLGRFLYLADYLEPERGFEDDERAALRARLPADHEAVLVAVCARRIAWQLDQGKSIHPETLSFWNELVEGE